jgi:hypothetical protein
MTANQNGQENYEEVASISGMLHELPCAGRQEVDEQAIWAAEQLFQGEHAVAYDGQRINISKFISSYFNRAPTIAERRRSRRVVDDTVTYVPERDRQSND